MSRFYRKIGAWLGLLAILMATLAPTISQALAARADMDSMAGEHCDMPAMSSMPDMPDMPGMSGMSHGQSIASSASADPGDSHAHHNAMSGGDVCGYCSLLAHMPVVPSVGALFFVTIRAIVHTVATRFESVQRVEPLTFAQPRAPPFIC